MSPGVPDRLFPICETRLWGHIDRAGETVVVPRYGDAQPFADGLGAVTLARKVGYINAQGETVIEPRWDLAQPFSEGLAVVGTRRGKRSVWEVIDRAGRVVIPARTTAVGAFSCGLATATVPSTAGPTPTLAGYLHPTGEWAIPPRYPFAARFSEGLAVARDPVTGFYGFLSTDGAWALPPRYANARSFSHGLAAVWSADHVVTYIDRSGAEVFGYPIPYLDAGTFSEGLVWFPGQASSLDRGYMDPSGTVVIPPRAGLGGNFHCGRAQVHSPLGYIDREGALVVASGLVRVEDFSDGLARVHPDGTRPMDFGYIDVRGHWVWRPAARPFPDLPAPTTGFLPTA